MGRYNFTNGGIVTDAFECGVVERNDSFIAVT